MAEQQTLVSLCAKGCCELMEMQKEMRGGDTMKFVLASHNKGKLAEMQAILGELGVEVVMPADVGVDVDVEETGTTFAENAGLKAQAIMQASGLPAIADDSGLCVDGLSGAPGDVLRPLRRGWTTTGRYRLLLDNMRGADDPRGPFPLRYCLLPSPTGTP